MRTPRARLIPLQSTASDCVGELPGSAWDPLCGCWTVSSDHPNLSCFASYMTPGQRLMYNLEEPEVDLSLDGEFVCGTPASPSVTPARVKLCHGFSAMGLFTPDLSSIHLHYPTHLHSGPSRLAWHPPSSDGVIYAAKCAITLAAEPANVCTA